MACTIRRIVSVKPARRAGRCWSAWPPWAYGMDTDAHRPWCTARPTMAHARRSPWTAGRVERRGTDGTDDIRELARNCAQGQRGIEHGDAGCLQDTRTTG